MSRQKSPRSADNWQISERDGLWASREIPPGWRLEHRIMLEGTTPVIAETRLRWPDDKEPPSGGIGSSVLRQARVRGLRETAAKWLAARGVRGIDMRALEAVGAAARRRGEARRWSLAITSLAYVKAIESGSAHPNEDAARALGLPTRTVRDRIYAARHRNPPLLTGGSRRGLIGTPELTEFGLRAIDDRIRRVIASLGMHPDKIKLLAFWKPTVAAFDSMFTELLRDAEGRIPGLWEMSVDEVAETAASLPPPMFKVPAGKRLELTLQGVDVVDDGTAP